MSIEYYNPKRETESSQEEESQNTHSKQENQPPNCSDELILFFIYIHKKEGFT